MESLNYVLSLLRIEKRFKIVRERSLFDTTRFSGVEFQLQPSVSKEKAEIETPRY